MVVRDEVRRIVRRWRFEHQNRRCPPKVRAQIEAFVQRELAGMPRGFAKLTPEERRQLGSKGGRKAQAAGTANSFTPETAAVAGRLGALRLHELGKAHVFTSEEAKLAWRRRADSQVWLAQHEGEGEEGEDGQRERDGNPA